MASVVNKWHVAPALCLGLMLTPASIYADEQQQLLGPNVDIHGNAIPPEPALSKDEYHANFWDYQEMDESEGSDYATEGLEWTLGATHKFANWVDHFFDDERVRTQQNETRIKISARGFVDQDEDNETDLKFSIKVKLPKARKRFQLFLTNDLDEDMDASSNAPPVPRDDRDDQTFLGLRSFDYIGDKIPGNTNTAAGVNLKNGKYNYFIEPRYNYLHHFKKWDLYFLQKARYSRADKWELRTRLDFDRILSEKFFFRLNSELYWKEDNEDYDGFENTLRFYFAQRLRGRQALIYELNNLFYSEPDYHLDSSSIAVRYRRQIWRSWMFVEAAPQVAFRDAEDFSPSLGMLVKLELLMKKSK